MNGNRSESMWSDEGKEEENKTAELFFPAPWDVFQK